MEIIHERVKLRLMDSDDVETLFSIVKEIGKFRRI